MPELESDTHGFLTEAQLRALVAARGWEALGSGTPILLVSEVKPSEGLADGSDLSSRVTLDREARQEAAGTVTGGDPSRYRGKLAPLRKRPGNPFPNLISLGRALTCDVVLSLATVSKLQGYFRQQDDGSWAFLDQRSLNGSRLNGEVLAPNRLYPLQSGDRLEIADEVVLIFVTSAGLPEYFSGALPA